MPRPKGSKNKKTLEKEGKLDEIEAKKLEEKNESKNQKEADKAFFDLVKRAKELDALVEEFPITQTTSETLSGEFTKRDEQTNNS
jgi:hypothetical protein